MTRKIPISKQDAEFLMNNSKPSLRICTELINQTSKSAIPIEVTIFTIIFIDSHSAQIILRFQKT